MRSLLRSAVVAAACSVAAFAQTSVPTFSRAVGERVLTPNGAAVTINLADYFTVPGVTGEVVLFDTSFGKFAVDLRRDVAPRHVENFLGYVQRGDYTNSFFHRSAAFDASGNSIIQGGGYTISAAGAAQIPAQAPVPLEYRLANERGTLAAARAPGDVNSATSQWYFNVRDNSALLNEANNGGYTVFGRVIGNGMSVVDAIAAQPRVDAPPFSELPVRDYAGGDVQIPNLILVNFVQPINLFPGSAGQSLVTFTAQSSATTIVAAALNGSQLTLTPGLAGTAYVTVRASDVSGSSVEGRIRVTVTPDAPGFTRPPTSHTIARGDTLVLNAGVQGAASYQWQRNGADLAGQTGASLVLRNVAAADAGDYRLVARNPVGTVTSAPATVTVRDAAVGEVGRLVNLSIRAQAGAGNEVLIIGFLLGGEGTSGTTPLLLRGMGPSLSQLNVSGPVPDPMATLYRGSTVMATNDNWGGDATIEARRQQVSAFPFLSAGSLDAAFALAPESGAYTMHVAAKGGATGLALAELYEAQPAGGYAASSPRLVNVSARTHVGVGNDVLIAGFSIQGNTSRTVLIRGIGPGLAVFGLEGRLADPQIRLYRQGESTPLAENNDWGGDAQISTVGDAVFAFPLLNAGSTDAAMLVTLPPGSYSALVSGADGGQGIALVEVYEVR
ncbi:peptidylprolyl isomerase [Opitutus sp. ER46]|uniref:peptidylprolyl isomerase n=1 Tax=Opitutus sp. ER46 TaxID=2161864 RepID=UPI000D310EE2|nr:peptidylprolyl isomerase [Opitutus sp. ER46]PTX91646.1 hypothetical protein DB354_17405 [Opitutus sp. ER46]